MALAKTAKFAKLMIFLDDPTKTTKLTTFRDGLAKTAKFGKLTIFTMTLKFIIHVFQLIVKRIVLCYQSCMWELKIFLEQKLCIWFALNWG